MKLLKDDPRLLQFVLDEISSNDRLVVETAINNQPEIAAEIQLLKNIYLDVSTVESLPNDLSLTSERRKSLFVQTIDKKAFSFFGLPSSFKFWSYSAGGLIAATFALLVFTHSLKNEVKDQIASVRPTIPADSDLAAGSAPPSVVSADKTDSEEIATLGQAPPEAQVNDASKEIAKPDEVTSSEPEKKITVDEVADDSQTEKLYAISRASKDLKQDESPQAAVVQKPVAAAPPSEFAEVRRGEKEFSNAVATNKIVRNDLTLPKAVQSKKMFASSKSGSAINTTVPKLVESEKAGSEGLKSAFGSGELETKGRSTGTGASPGSDLTTHQFEVLISSI